MADTLYFDPPLLDRVKQFSKAEQSQILSTLERLNTDPLGNSKQITHEPNGLREAQAGDIHILLHHDATDNLTIVTDIFSVAPASEAA